MNKKINDANAILGRSPAAGLKAFLIYSAALLAINGAIFLLSKNAAGVIFVIVILLYMLAYKVILDVIFNALSKTSWAIYKKTRAAISSGEINPAYVIRNPMEVSGIAVVDEGNKKLMVNGGIFSFSDVKSIRRRSSKMLEIVFNAGATPILCVELDSERSLDVAFHRLSNSLGFS
jgi:hypothetical protein